MHFDGSEGFPSMEDSVPARDTPASPGVLPDGQSSGGVAAAVIWKFRLTFRPGNYGALLGENESW